MSKNQTQTELSKEKAEIKKKARDAVKDLAQKINVAKKDGTKLSVEELSQLSADAKTYYFQWKKENTIISVFQFYVIAVIALYFFTPLNLGHDKIAAVGKTTAIYSSMLAVVLYLKIFFYDNSLNLKKYILSMYGTDLHRYTAAAIFSLFKGKDGKEFCLNKNKIIRNYIIAVLTFFLLYIIFYQTSWRVHHLSKMWFALGVVASLAIVVFPSYESYKDYEEEK